MQDIYQEIYRELTQGREVILATIIRQKGSSPRSQGTQFLIRADGTFFGSIGGGRLEADVLTAAPDLFSKRKNQMIYFRLRGEEVAETEMICGGEVDVYLEHLSDQDSEQREVFKKILGVRQQGRPCLIATLLEDEGSEVQKPTKVLYDPEEIPGLGTASWITPVIQQLPQVLESNQATLLATVLEGKEKKIFLEPLIAPSIVYIFGAGHISLSLCPLVKMVGFQVVIFDDRGEFANSQRFPEADEIVVRPFEQILHEVSFGPNAFIVVVTRGHLHDHQILRKVLKGAPRYIGMIGSRHKREAVFKALREEGFSEKQIRSVYSPIGLDIQAETPEEIAVSITAELIQVRAQGRTKKNNSDLSPLKKKKLEAQISDQVQY
jgi:xanthine dehydrogenase accessory factor